MKTIGISLAALAVGLAGCDAGPKAVAQAPAASPAATAVPATRSDEIAWAASRSRTSQEAAEAQFARNGADFGAASLEDYVAEANAFAKKPPKDAEMATRGNGDVLLYDKASNVFAVVTADGKPRALFKPRDGAAYWAEQKARAGRQASSRSAGSEG